MLKLESKRKFFNYRPMVSMCLFFMAGIVFVVGLYSGGTFRILLSCLMLLALISTIVVKALFAKNRKIFKVVSILVVFILSSIITVTIIEINNNSATYKGDYFVSGRVCERTYENSTGKLVVTVDSVNLTNLKTLEKSSVSGKMRFYLEEADCRSMNFELGELVNASLSVKSASLFLDGEPNFYMYNKNIKLLGYGSEEEVVSLNELNANIFDKFKTKVKSVLDLYLTSDYSELGYTMLFGDKAGLSDEITANYSASGISHLLAVSGLHVGFVVTLLTVLLNAFKANSKVKFFIISGMVFIYAFLCGFSVSVTRALIMTVVMLYAKMRFKEYDGLSSLAVAGLIILLINPLDLYNVGFQLSFGSVASIILLTPAFTSFFSKYFYNKFASALALSLSAEIGIIPSLVLSFSKISVFAIVTNIIVIPIASIAFMFLFVAVIVSLILPALGMFTYIFEFLMRIVTGISQLTGAITFASANQVVLILFSIFIVMLAIMCSDYVFMQKKSRAVMCCGAGVLSLVAFVCIFIC